MKNPDSTTFSSEEKKAFSANLEGVKVFKETFKRLTLIAHRGMGPSSCIGSSFSRDVFPENTIRAFKQAIILGADGIELDIFKSIDDQIMVIHDNELCRNLYGVDRKRPPEGETVESYTVGAKEAARLSKFQVGPLLTDTIPTLEEVFDLVKVANKIRVANGLGLIILNIEIKDEAAIDSCLSLISRYVKCNIDSGVNFDTICFCSFNHDSLTELKVKAENMQIKGIKIAPGIKTATLFGDEMVNNDFTVKQGAKYKQSGIDYLKKLIEENNFTAYDAVLWDIYFPLIDVAEEGGKQIHASTSDHRNYLVPAEQCTFLIEMSKRVPVYFKCDEVDKARMELLKANEALDWYGQEKLFAQHLNKPTKVLVLDEEHSVSSEQNFSI